MNEDHYDETFVVKIAISGSDENELMHFLSEAIDDEDQSLSFDNLVPIVPEFMMFSSHPIRYMLLWRIENWGVAYDCDKVVKDVRNTQYLFLKNPNKRYVEHLQFTSLFNVPVKLFKDISKDYENLEFNIVFIKNNLETCGRVIIENGEIIDQTIINNANYNYIEFLLTAKHMYDENYPNEKVEELIEAYQL